MKGNLKYKTGDIVTIDCEPWRSNCYGMQAKILRESSDNPYEYVVELLADPGHEFKFEEFELK